jgi:adenylylsulfate kinase-like enzyme
MKEKLERVITALEVEAEMIELHAQRLLEMVPSLAGDEQRHELLQLANEEADRAEAIKRQIRLLQDHL